MFTRCNVKLIPTTQRRNDQLRLEIDFLVTDNHNFPLLLTFVYDRTGSPAKDMETVVEQTSAQGVDTECGGKRVDKSDERKANHHNGFANKMSEKEKVSEPIAKKEKVPASEEVSRL